MKGVSFLIDEDGKKKAVQIELEELGEDWEDFWDGLTSILRRNEEPKVKWADLKAEIAAERSKDG